MTVLMTPAWANNHSMYRDLGVATGIWIAPLRHGEMQAVSDNRKAIVALARQEFAADPIVAKLLDFEAWQYFYAWGGIMPWSVIDAESPWHLPTHGFLTADRILVIRMEELAPMDARVQGLSNALVKEGVEVSTCEYSFTEGFHTSQPVGLALDKFRGGWMLVPYSLMLLITLLAGGFYCFNGSLGAFVRFLREHFQRRALG